jgi:hypothetical protein
VHHRHDFWRFLLVRVFIAVLVGCALPISAAGAGVGSVRTAGVLDHSFGRGGVVVTELRTRGSLTASVSLSDLALDPRARIVAVGNDWKYGGRHVDSVLVRYASGGRVDRRLTIGSGTVDSVATQRDRKVVVGGRAHCLFVQRLLANLREDPTFGGSGTVCSSDSRGQDGQVGPIVVLPDSCHRPDLRARPLSG